MSDVQTDPRDPIPSQVGVPPRKRLNASMNSKGFYQLDATVETYNGESPLDQLMALVKDAEARFAKEGKRLAV